MALFVWGRLRYDLVALLALLAAIATGIVPADKAFSGFSDDIVIIVACALLVSAAVGRSGVVEDALVRIGPYLTTPHHPGRRAGRHRDGALRLREEHRRARDADAGRVPARPQDQRLALDLPDADGVRLAARRHRHAGRHLAEHHRGAAARRAHRRAVRHVRFHAGRHRARDRGRRLPQLRAGGCCRATARARPRWTRPSRSKATPPKPACRRSLRAVGKTVGELEAMAEGVEVFMLVRGRSRRLTPVRQHRDQGRRHPADRRRAGRARPPGRQGQARSSRARTPSRRPTRRPTRSA